MTTEPSATDQRSGGKPLPTDHKTIEESSAKAARPPISGY